MDIILRGEAAAEAERRAVDLMWAYHSAACEGLGEVEVARRRAAYLAFVEGVGHDPLGES